jgi:hypothetical protein
VHLSCREFLGLFRQIIHDVKTLNQILKRTANPGLLNEGIEPLSQEVNPDVQRIPSRLNVTGPKLSEVQMDHENSSESTTPVEGPNAMAIMCLRACCHRADIYQTNGLKFNDFSEYRDQVAGFVLGSSLANEGKHTSAATSGSQIMDMTVSHNAKAQFPPPK